MALVLTLKLGDPVSIGENMSVTCIETGKGKVRIAFNATREVQILRRSAKKRTRAAATA